jgi:hypothetical protein
VGDAVKRLASLLVPTCLLLARPDVSVANAIVEAEIGMVHESNVGLAQLGRDKRSDEALQTAVSAGFALPVGDRHLWSATADLKGVAWEHLTGLSHVAAGAGTSFRTRLGLGIDAPWIRLAGAFAREEYDFDLRDGFRYRIGPSIGKRFWDRLDARLEYTFEEFIADHGKQILARLPGDVFDLQSHTFAVRTDFFVTKSIALFASYAWRDGDVVSTSPRNTTVFNASSAVTDDPVFGSRAFAYKVAATVQMMGAGISVGLGDHVAVHGAYEYQTAQAWRGLDYTNHVVRGGLLYSY